MRLPWASSVLSREKFSRKRDAGVFSDFVTHFEELRRRLLFSLILFVLASVAAYFFSGQLIDFFTLPLKARGDVQLFFQKPFEAFMTHLKVAALAGVVMTSPFLLSQIWFFIVPGLYQKEKKILLPMILISAALFFAGVIFAYAYILPWGLGFLLSYQTESLKPLLGIGPYFSFLTGTLIAFGVLFDFPVFIVGLVRLGVVKTKTLVKARKAFIVIIFVLSALLTPSPDPVSQLLLALPLMLLFEISLWISRFFEK
ncbi:MAG: twin-arginine translocase subunit TatC [Candidatus Omnitrophica bacterium]|nr:twin-arginine translocase subunit TatC [Candidatus Omnitrophota bacterium]